MFSPINKALNLLKKQDETGRHTLTPEERREISSILSSPIRALGEDINDFLLSIRNIIEGEPSILKDRKRDRTLKWIEHLLNSELSSIKGKSELLQSRIDAVKGKLSDMTILKDSPPQLKIPYNWDFIQVTSLQKNLPSLHTAKSLPFTLISLLNPHHPPKFP